MTEVKLRHLIFFIFLFILIWFWNWVALVFFALIIISIVGTMYGAHIHVPPEKCYYYSTDTGICHFDSYETMCTGKCDKYVRLKTNLGEK